jgi:hypothetical protein
MMRTLGAILLFLVVGTALTLFVYRVVIEGPLAPVGMERSLDGLIIFLSIVLNTALAFVAAAVASVMAAQSRWPFVAVLVGAVALAGLLGAGMMFWFVGLNAAYPTVMALNAGLCAVFADRLGLLRGSA